MHQRFDLSLPIALALAASLACTPADESLEAAGARVYKANCIACHHPDPARAGSLGPAIAGSSRALLEARVLRGEYPDGYVAQQDSTLMQPLPYLKDDIDALAAYLAKPDS